MKISSKQPLEIMTLKRSKIYFNNLLVGMKNSSVVIVGKSYLVNRLKTYLAIHFINDEKFLLLPCEKNHPI